MAIHDNTSNMWQILVASLELKQLAKIKNIAARNWKSEKSVSRFYTWQLWREPNK